MSKSERLKSQSINWYDTDSVLTAMLTANTGTHFLDSGGDYNRHWQKNATRNFIEEEEVIYSFDPRYPQYGITREVRVFHFLRELQTNLLTDMFNNLNWKCRDWDADTEDYGDHIHGVSAKAWRFLERYCHKDKTALKIHRVWNTYNGNSDLDQVLQGATLTIRGEDYVLIQVHQGADVRGGYTDAVLFKTLEYGMINEGLMEYMDGDEIMSDLEDGYITTIYNEEKIGETMSAEEVLAIINAQ